MDISITTKSANTTPNSTTKLPEQSDNETATATRIHPSSKPLSITNGVLKRHHLHLAVPPAGVVSYKECLKNHAASLGGHALDGCGEFMPSPNADTNNPTSLKCAVCGCHRNFHRREPEDPLPPPPPPPTTVIEYQPHHRHHPPPPQGLRSRNSVSPPPISSYYPSAPHMLLALSGGMLAEPDPPRGAAAVVTPGPISRKRFRTRFSQSQKEKMYKFAEKVEWKMQKKDEDLVQEFCNEIGVEKGVFKVWMHNNKNTYAKKDNGTTTTTNSNLFAVDDQSNHNNNIISNNGSENVNQYQNDNVGTNGSSSSS